MLFRPLCISNAEDESFNGRDGLCWNEETRLYASEERVSLSFKELFEVATCDLAIVVFLEVAHNGGPPATSRLDINSFDEFLLERGFEVCLLLFVIKLQLRASLCPSMAPSNNVRT